MDDDLDLYADLDVAPSRPSAPQSLPQKPVGHQGQDAAPLESADYSREAMGDLLSFLQETGDDDDDDDLTTAVHHVRGNLPGSGLAGTLSNESSVCSAEVLSVEEPPEDSRSSGSRPAKRGRFDFQPPEPAPPQPDKEVTSSGCGDDCDEFDFDFEADLPAASSVPLPRASPAHTSRPPPVAAPSDPGYRYNPATGRWEAYRLPTRTGPSHLESDTRAQPRAGRTKASLCRQYSAGWCKWGDQCYFAHGKEQLRPSLAQGALKRRLVEESVAAAKKDADEGVCVYPQALAIRLLIKFEDDPMQIIHCLFEAGLPAGTSNRKAVKDLLKFCHPDKCRHPNAKQAVQILGPLLAKISSG